MEEHNYTWHRVPKLALCLRYTMPMDAILLPTIIIYRPITTFLHHFQAIIIVHTLIRNISTVNSRLISFDSIQVYNFGPCTRLRVHKIFQSNITGASHQLHCFIHNTNMCWCFTVKLLAKWKSSTNIITGWPLSRLYKIAQLCHFTISYKLGWIL